MQATPFTPPQASSGHFLPSARRRQLTHALAALAVLPATSLARAAATVDVRHAKGQAAAPTRPHRMAVYDLGALDALQALGITPKAVPSANYPSYLHALAQPQVLKAGSLFQPDWDVLSRLRPDLVIVGGRSAARYDTLSKIAPVLDFSLDGQRMLQDMERNLQALGQIFGLQQQAQALMEPVRQHVQSVRAAAEKAPPGLLLLQAGENLIVQGPGTRLGTLFHDVLGVKAMSGLPAASAPRKPLTAKDIVALNPPWLYVIDRNAAVGGAATAITAQQLLQRPEFAHIPAVAQARVAHLQAQNWYLMGLAGPTALRQGASEMLQTLQKAAG